MSFFQWDDINHKQGIIRLGTLTAINRDALTGDVENIGTGIPIHYHCNSEDVYDQGANFGDTYPDSADLKGATAFRVGDRVKVLYRLNEKPVIVGIKGEARNCCSYLFKVFGETCEGSSTGGELTEKVYFTVLHENRVPVPMAIEASYNLDSGFWEMVPDPLSGFDEWYQSMAEEWGLNPDPEDPSHYYDYEAAYSNGVRSPDETGHWPSEFKEEDHPDRYIDGEDTRGEGTTVLPCTGPFWVQIFSPGYKISQYPGRVKAEDMYQEDDLIEADGAEREENLQCIESETGYWEDWEDNLFCGKHQWKLSAYIYGSEDSGGSGEICYRETCYTLPINRTTEVSTYVTEISNEVMSVINFSAYGGGETDGASVTEFIFVNSEEDPLPNILIHKNFKLNFPSYLADWSGPYPYVEWSIAFDGIDSEGEQKLLMLFLEFSPDGITSGEEALIARGTPSGRKYVWIGDLLAPGVEISINLFSEELKYFTKDDTIKELRIFSMGSAGGRLAYYLNYIHFAKWEEWSEGGITVNNNFTSIGSGGTAEVKADESIEGNYVLEINANKDVGQSVDLFCAIEEDYQFRASKCVIKFSGVSTWTGATLSDWGKVYLTISSVDDEFVSILLVYGNTHSTSGNCDEDNDWNNRCLTEEEVIQAQEPEGVEIDITPYITSEISSVRIRADSISNLDYGSLYAVIDFIDFIE